MKQYLSIAIITCNRCDELRRTIDSCIEHAKMNFELVIVDNGSTDNTRTMLETMSLPNFLKPIFYFSEKNLGVAGGRNKAFELCSSDIIYFIDDDAYIDENSCSIKYAVDYMNLHSNLFSLATEIYDTKNQSLSKNGVVNNKYDEQYKYSFSFIGASHFIRKSLVKSMYLYPPTLKYGSEEFYATTISSANGHPTVYFDDFKVVHDPSNKTRTTDAEIYYNVAINKCVVKSLVNPIIVQPICTTLFLLRLFRVYGIFSKKIFSGIKDYNLRLVENKQAISRINFAQWKALAKKFGYLRLI